MLIESRLRDRCARLSVLVAVCAWFGAAPVAEGLDKKPNVVFILTDDQRWDQMSIQPDTHPSRASGMFS